MMMVIIVNACPMCLNDEENVDHLPLNCRVAQGLWSILFSWFGCSSVLPSTICGLFENWHLVLRSDRGRAMCSVQDCFFGGFVDYMERKILTNF